MRVSLTAVCLVTMACSQSTTGPLLPADAGLPSDVQDLAPAALQPVVPAATDDIAGVTFAADSGPHATVAVAMPVETPELTQALWARQVTHALPDLSIDGATVSQDLSPGLVVWTVSASDEVLSDALSALLNAIAQPELSDDGLAGALSTRPHSSDPVDPATLRTLHDSVAVRQRLWVSADARARDALSSATQDWSAGQATTDGDAWLAAYAQQIVADATCRLTHLGSSAEDDIRTVAHGTVDRRTPVTAALQSWRASSADAGPALHQAIEAAALSQDGCASL